MDIRSYCKDELNTLWDESRRLVNPQEVYVDLSMPLYKLKNELLDANHKNKIIYRRENDHDSFFCRYYLSVLFPDINCTALSIV